MNHASFVITAFTIVGLATPSIAAPDQSAGRSEDRAARPATRAQPSRFGPEVTETTTQTYKVPDGGALDLQNISGDVRVTTGGEREIRVEAVKRVRTRDPGETRRYLDALRVETTQVGGRVEVRSVYPRTSGRTISASIDYAITVPTSAAVAVKGISGNVSVQGVRGEVRAESISGNVEVVATPNVALAKTVSGDVHARDISAETGLTLGTISGTLVAASLKIRTLDATSVSGDVRLSDLRVERLTVKNVSGDIIFAGRLTRSGRYEFNSHSGGIRLTLGDTPGFDLDASTFSGSIRSDFPVTLRTTDPDARRSDRGARGISPRAIRGTYGDAGAVLAIRTFSGSVAIQRD
ncbi:MAG: DUF4097 family beta strand repeat-containing protein [Acidobacteriota bacterium]